MEKIENTIWKIVDCYFRDNPQCLVRHHIDSFNDFFKHDIFRIVKEMNPIRIVSKIDETTGEYLAECNLYIGGKEGDRLYFAKPTIFDDTTGDTPPHYMYPNEARLRNMTYAMTIHYDVIVEVKNVLNADEIADLLKTGGGQTEEMIDAPRFVNRKTDPEIMTKIMERSEADIHEGDDDLLSGGSMSGGSGKGTAQGTKQAKGPIKPITVSQHANIKQSVKGANVQTTSFPIDKILLGRFPIMVQSDNCILSGMPREMRFNMGECRNDHGGYFIIDGKEKSVVPQEKFGDNMLRINKSSAEDILYSAEIKSVSEDSSKPVRSLRLDLVAPTSKYTNNNIVVSIPNVRKPVPLFIVFRALGITTDKEIIETCLLDLEKYKSIVDLFIPSVHDAGPIMTRTSALQYIAQLAKIKTTDHANYLLSDYFLPHIGETCFKEKAFFLGYMARRLILAYSGLEAPIDRDSYRYKRLELTGTLIYQLFSEYYKAQTKTIYVEFERKIVGDRANYENNLEKLIRDNYRDVFSKNRIVEEGFRKAFKGNWGSTEHTKRLGAVQDLNRLSYNSALSQLRKTNLEISAGAKLVGPRVLSGSQWGLFDPLDTPDGGNIGLHKQLTIMSYVTRNISREPMLRWLRRHTDMKSQTDYTPTVLSQMTKILVNGYWAGVSNNALKIVEDIRFYRRIGLIPLSISVAFDIRQNTVNVFTDGGRIIRPVFYKHTNIGQMSFHAIEPKAELTWGNLVNGFNKPKLEDALPNYSHFYELGDLYDVPADSEGNPYQYERFIQKKSIIEYIDANEEETTLIAMKPEQVATVAATKPYTNCEIHESLIFGMMSNLIIYPQHNPASRNSFSCGQSKQAVSLYHTNYNMRMDKTAVILTQGQRPLVKSRYLEYINNEENSYGENAIVAIACYTGYNVEDAILVNEGAIKRGLFRTTYFSVYETHEERSAKTDSYKKIGNIEAADKPVLGLKMGYDYSKLDEYGLVREGTPIDDKTVLIGCFSGSNDTNSDYYDASKTTKKGQLGVVDKSFITESDEGRRIAKVRLREERLPAIGDKMASRSGQKGTIGMVIREEDMPFTRDGVRPDLIINPHAIPTRMTIGQLVECITGKACLLSGTHGDCTAFTSDDSQLAPFGRMLSKAGLHSSGNELLYNGMTGEQIEAEIFMGPTYYMRLKHMVKDKVNFRATGPRTGLTRQPVSGRANDGGLRIGEMERDSIISHGATDFLRESMLVRGDQYYMAVCNKTGGVAIYNPEKNLFLSPLADGPIKYTDSLDGKTMNVEQVSKYGRSFSVVRVPYVFKLFMQELQTINVKMAIITEDNVDQFDSMNFSANLSLLSGLSSPGDVSRKILDDKDNAEMIKKNIKQFREKQQLPTPEMVKDSVKGHWENYLKFKGLPMDFQYDDAALLQEGTVMTPGLSPKSPEFSPPTPEDKATEFWEEYLESKGLPAEFEYDAEVMPEGQGYVQNSPAFSPTSPAFSPTSPAFSPTSPAFSPKALGIPYGSNVPENYESNGQVLYNEKTGQDYPYDAAKGHYIDPTTGYIVVRKEFLAQNNLLDDSPAQSSPSLIQSYSKGETVYLLTDPITPWTITLVGEYNIVITNRRNGQNKVVDAKDITRTPQQQQQPYGKPPSPEFSPENSPLQTPAIHFQPNIIVSTGANSQVSSPTPLDTQSAQVTTNPTATTQATPQSDFFDKPVISKQKADSNPSSVLSGGGGFTVKLV
jgi:DNA-directed RNA polymerase II subunit RPB2